ncbi:MAG: DUF4960 domain-containing protein [Prevotella sp.]|jgi:hypothetical protein|nr:DUF4960 domain-containing protein [Prevotella sp.]
MKTKIISAFATLVAALAFTACSSDNVSDLALSGDCMVESFELNNTYKGVVDLSKRNIKVKVPVQFNEKSQMKITDLDISAGATANMKEGDVVNFSSAQVLHITNGDLFLDWTVSVKNDEARINSFIINDTYKATVNENDHTITAFLPASVDVTKIIPTITLSDDATISPMGGVMTDFTSPVTYTVTDNTATATYTVIIQTVKAPKAIFLGSSKATKMEELEGEELEACKWMLSNVEQSMFVSWGDMGNMDLSECEVIFWHWQHQPSETLSDFESGATSAAMAYRNKLQEYYKNGGAFILGRAAVNYAASLGAVKDQLCANNCWGASDDGGDIISAGGEWSFLPNDASHPIWQNLVGGNEKIITTDGGYQISNCVSQWGAWSFDGFADWENKTGCKALGHGGDGAVVVWEAPASNGNFGKGGIICFGSGCYDWYSPNPYTPFYHDNVGIMTGNAFKYLSGK